MLCGMGVPVGSYAAAIQLASLRPVSGPTGPESSQT